MKLGRNDPCWCGSGVKFKNCHTNRADDKRMPFEAIKDGMMKSAKVSKCLHPEASNKTCNKIISAHTIQRSRILKKIANSNNHVLSFYPPEPDKDARLKVHNIGWKKASTFQAFCGYHDEMTFVPLEKKEFIGSKEQIFLIAYRALCWELYQKERASLAFPNIKSNVDQGLTKNLQIKMQEMINAQILGNKKGIRDLQVAKMKMDEVLITRKYDLYRYFEIILKGNSIVAATGAISPTFSLAGSKLQTLHDPNSVIQLLAFGIDVRSDNLISIVFLWDKEHLASQKYVNDLNALNDKELAEFLLQFFFAFCENTYFSKSWWDTLSNEKKNKIIELMLNTNPYYFDPDFNLNLSLAPWQIYKRNFS